MKKAINVTKSFLPPIDEYIEYLREIWDGGQLTNQGPMLERFEAESKKLLGVKNIQVVGNGTLALQLIIKELDLGGSSIITTPFSYVATTSAILWENAKPIYVDINADTLCIDAEKIEKAVTSNTKAILAVHVFGMPCEVEKIQSIARKHKLKVIYDAAHAFGVKYKDKSLLSYGDVSACSFHATKLMHTVEGGCIVTDDEKLNGKLDLAKRFGHNGDDHLSLGINAKTSELHAAMGLCNLKYLETIIDSRKKIYSLYRSKLRRSGLYTPTIPQFVDYNYSYYPVIFPSQQELLQAINKLGKMNVYPRRYFYPSLNKLRYVKGEKCPVSEDISERIMCLPLFPGLDEDDVDKICLAITGY